MEENKSSNWRIDFRIIGAITAKDILEAVKNRYAIGVVITALLVAVLYSFIPALTSLDNLPTVLVYDAANSSLGAQLKNSQALDVYSYPSEEVMLDKLAGGEVPELGLVIPAGFNQSLTGVGDQQIDSELTAYVLYWVSDKELANLIQEVKTEITRLAGKPVEIRMAEERLIPTSDQHTLGFWIGAALVYLVIYTGIGLISNLMLEEKQTRTLDVLLVSPASTWHVVISKAITGLFYCLLGIAVTLAINHKIILHWWLIIPVLFLGALLSVSLGLIVGTIIEERGQLSLWTFGLLIPLLIPVFLSFMRELFPNWLNQVLLLIPSVTFMRLLLISFSVIPPVKMLLVQFAWITFWAGASLAAAILILRRKQQKETGDAITRNRKIDAALHADSQRGELPSTTSLGNNAASPSLQSFYLLNQSKFSARPVSWVRIVQSIAVKDIRQSIHNKLILSILLGTTLLVAGNALLLRGLSAYTGSPAQLTASSTPVLSIMISLTLMTLGVSLVPLLMVEEKETHTLDTLLVSPASYMQLVVGKAIAGGVYCLSGVIVILIAYHFLLVHWELALLAMLLGTAFAVALGLLVGMISSNPTMVGTWSALIVLVLIVPAVLGGLISLERMSWVGSMLSYWPSTAIVKLFNLAMVIDPPQSAIIWNTSVIAFAAFALYSLTWWKVRRNDQ